MLAQEPELGYIPFKRFRFKPFLFRPFWRRRRRIGILEPWFKPRLPWFRPPWFRRPRLPIIRRPRLPWFRPPWFRRPRLPIIRRPRLPWFRPPWFRRPRPRWYKYRRGPFMPRIISISPYTKRPVVG